MKIFALFIKVVWKKNFRLTPSKMPKDNKL